MFRCSCNLTADGAFLLGVMGPHTFNGGEIYFPCGTPDPDDIIDGKVDLDLSVRRELKEETGLDVAEFEAEPGWTTVADGPLIAQIKVLRSNETADVLQRRILAHLASEEHSELADIRIVRGPAISIRLCRVLLRHFWRRVLPTDRVSHIVGRRGPR